ncbi:unnamed protein product [Blepharisma stoltei]|uniref:Uncharacterized protein n=1 Tax=Blepharisma stoltei TaxID=1481888 RepID=A0AAU9JYY1_9CILI|nr:unnamed protein product [Blepharisma stoltei]
MLKSLPSSLIGFFSSNQATFIRSLDSRNQDIIANELDLILNEANFTSWISSEPKKAFKVLMSIGYPSFLGYVDYSSLKDLVDSEYADIVLEFLCKVSADLPESIKDRVKTELIKLLEELDWEHLDPYDILYYNTEDQSHTLLSLLITFGIRFNLEETVSLINNEKFRFFLDWLIQEKDDFLWAELYLLIMSSLAEYNFALFYRCWNRKSSKWYLLAQKIRSRQDLVCLMEILAKYNCVWIPELKEDDTFFQKIWNFMFDINNEHDISLFLTLCSQSDEFTVFCFDKLIDLYSANPDINEDKIITVLSLHEKLMIYANIGSSLEYPKFAQIVDQLFIKGKTSRYLISFVDNQLKSQLYMSDFLKIYFSSLSHGAAGRGNEEIVTKQMIIYTLANNAREGANERELIISDYIRYLMDYLAENVFTHEEIGNYLNSIKQIIRYIPSLYEYIIQLASEKLKKANDHRHTYLFAEIADIALNKDIGIPKQILEIFQHIAAYLDSGREESDKDYLKSTIANYTDSQIKDINPFKVRHEHLNDATKIECWIRSVLIKKGAPNIMKRTLLPNDINFIKQILQKLENSFPFESIFNNNIPYPIRLYFVSHFMTIFSMNLQHGIHNNILTEANSYAAKMIGSVCEPISFFDKVLFSSLVESNVARTAFTEYGYDLRNAKGFEEKTFYVDLPRRTHGVTVLGGVILLNLVTKEQTPFFQCVKIIAYLHELAHALRKTENGLYSFENHTPEKSERFYEGYPMTKRDDNFLKEAAKKEGGMQLETILFGNFVNKVNDEQISFINDITNWNMSLDEFKSKLAKLNSGSSTYYQLCRDQYYSIDRAPHINTSYWC